MARRGSAASGRLVAGVLVILGLLAANNTFVPGPLRGSSSTPQYENWALAEVQTDAQAVSFPTDMAPRAAALAGMLGLMSGLAPVNPVFAEEAVSAAPTEKVAQAANYVATKQKLDEAKKEEAGLKSQAPTKEERLKAQIARMKTEEGGDNTENFAVNRGRESKKENTKRRKVKEIQEKKPNTGFSFALPSLSLPSFSVPEDTSTPLKKKVFISPADELDEDELPLSRENRPLLVLILLFPSAVYIFFWVAGSLDII
mmetsp:Transcript_28696/g.51254  ORF Transcript_28696/g.51254 Transcript_28696/m.51254 type:complete len:257 (-) Transcript_28696:112-882(-)